MTDFVSNLINKFKKTTPQDDPIIMIKPDNKNLVSSDSILLNEPENINVYSLKEVKVDKDGDITGDIHSKSCVVNGRVNGNILSVDSIEVKNTAIIEGNIKSGSIQIEAGSIINGFISIEKKIKLPSISATSAETVSNNSLNQTDITEGGYITVKTIPPPVGSSEIKTKSIEVKAETTQVPVEIQNILSEDEIIELKTPEITPKISEIKEELIKTSSITSKSVSELAEKAEIPPQTLPKKANTESSSDSWW